MNLQFVLFSWPPPWPQSNTYLTSYLNYCFIRCLFFFFYKQHVQAQKIIVIHPGSLYVRIGRASDHNPHTVLHAIAQRRTIGGATHVDTVLPPVVSRVSRII